MEESFCLACVGISFQISVSEHEWRPWLEQRYESFLVDAAPDWRVSLHHDAKLANTRGMWASHTPTETAFQINDHHGRINLDARIAEIYAHSIERAAVALERILSYVYAIILPVDYNGLLLHASGLANSRYAFAFSGASGSGKSTIAKLAGSGTQVMSDETVLVTCQGGDAVLSSTPFWGINTPEAIVQRRRIDRPLRAIFFLKQDSEFFLRQLSEAEAILSLFESQKAAVERTATAQAWLASASALISAAPIYELGFRPTPDLWPFLLSQGFEVTES
ncbi:MAG: hypothetical protein J5I90_16420 [Caldilineales bacterium]|nr:hypothetical protein [Caldilineales bacterium]